MKPYLKQFKKKLLGLAQSLPVSSRYVGPPKGYYASSEDYWQLCQATNSCNVDYVEFLPASFSQRKLPKFMSRRIHWKLQKGYFYSHPKSFVISIPNGKIFGYSGAVITHDDKLLWDVSWQMDLGRDVQKAKLHHVFNHLKLPECQKISQTVAVLANSDSEGYFHWFIDTLSRLEILRRTLPNCLDSIDQFIVRKGVSAITESLEILGVLCNKILFWNSDSHIQAASLVVPSLPSYFNPPSWVCAFLRDSFLKHKADIQSSRKKYISRSNARHRRVANEEDVINFLSNFGFVPVWLEGSSFVEQIALLANAEVIVAPHGDGSTNLLWCNPKTKVLKYSLPTTSTYVTGQLPVKLD